MKSEEDTFNALRRISFAQAFLYVTEHIRLGESVGMRHKDWLLANGWTLQEFQDEVVARQVPLSVHLITDPEWRERFHIVYGAVQLNS